LDTDEKNATLKDWAIIYSNSSRGNRDIQLADTFAYNLRQCGKQLGIKVRKPDLVGFNPRNRRLKIGKIVSNYFRNQRRIPKCILFLLDNK
jgi:hypothetical protein